MPNPGSPLEAQRPAINLPTSMILPIRKRPQAKTWPRLPFFCGFRRTASQHSSSIPVKPRIRAEGGPDRIEDFCAATRRHGCIYPNYTHANSCRREKNISDHVHDDTGTGTFTSPKAVTPSRAPLPRGTATRCREICCFSRPSRNSGPACVKVHDTGCGKYGECVSFSPFYLFIFPSPRVFIMDQVWR